MHSVFLSTCRRRKLRWHATDDWEANNVKTVANPLHSMAENAFPTLESSIKDSSAPVEVHLNAGAKVVADIDSLT